jgi:hypothetical protein
MAQRPLTLGGNSIALIELGAEKTYGGNFGTALSFVTSKSDGCERSASRPSHLTTSNKPKVTIRYET